MTKRVLLDLSTVALVLLLIVLPCEDRAAIIEFLSLTYFGA